MEQSGFAGCLARLLNGFRCEFLGDAAQGRSASVDLAVLKVAMAVAALDGDVSEPELAEFEQLAEECEIPEGEKREEVFEKCLRFSGYIDLQARRLPKEKLIELFVDESFDALPNSFFRGDMERIRRAFAMWVAIAMSDDYFAGIERQAIARLRERIADAVAALDESAVPMAVSSFALMSGSAAPVGLAARQPPTPEFLSRLEGVISRLKHEATAQEAALDLEKLIKG